MLIISKRKVICVKDNKSIVYVKLKPNETLVKKTAYNKKPAFMQIGVNDLINSIDVFQNMTQREYKVLKLLINFIDRDTHISDLKAARWIESKSDKVIFNYGMGALKKKNLVKCVGGRKSKIYMINPDFIQPSASNYDKFYAKFKEI